MGVHDRVQQKRFKSVAAEAWVSVVVAASHLTQQTDAVCAEHGITGDQYNILRILRGAGVEGLARGEIAGRLLRRAPDVTRMLDRLQRGRYVERRQSSEDARLSVAHITSAGRALLQRLDPEIDRVMDDVTAGLSETELRQLARLCSTLVP